MHPNDPGPWYEHSDADDAAQDASDKAQDDREHFRSAVRLFAEAIFADARRRDIDAARSPFGEKKQYTIADLAESLFDCVCEHLDLPSPDHAGARAYEIANDPPVREYDE